MNVKKILAGAVASVMALSTMAVAASAYTATIGFAGGGWTPDDWETTAEIAEDGTYSISTNIAPAEDPETGDEIPALATGAEVIVVDIADLANDLGVGADAEGYADLETGVDKMEFAKTAGVNVTDVKLIATAEDGTETEIAVDQSKVTFGDLEGNGKLRIELYNSTNDNPKAIDPSAIADAAKITVTFTISGIGGSNAGNAGDGTANDNNTADNGDTNAPTADKNTPDTGVEGVAVVAGLAIVAAGAVVVAKKRK